MQGTYTPKQPRKVPDTWIWSLFILMIILLVLATVGFTLYFVNSSRSSQLEPTPAVIVEPPVQEIVTTEGEATATEAAEPEQPTLAPTDEITESPVVVETAVTSQPSPTFEPGATLAPTATPTQQPPFAPTVAVLTATWRGEYYNNRDLAGMATLFRDDANLAFDWGTGAPASGLPATTSPPAGNAPSPLTPEPIASMCVATMVCVFG
jgi:hypothetical protein